MQTFVAHKSFGLFFHARWHNWSDQKIKKRHNKYDQQTNLYLVNATKNNKSMLIELLFLWKFNSYFALPCHSDKSDCKQYNQCYYSNNAYIISWIINYFKAVSLYWDKSFFFSFFLNLTFWLCKIADSLTNLHEFSDCFCKTDFKKILDSSLLTKFKTQTGF